MHKVAKSSKTLGGRGQQSKIDNSWLSEFGWGKHTLETAFVRHGKLNHHCAVCCSDIVLIIVMIANPDDPMVINYTSISDVEVSRQIMKTNSVVFGSESKESRRQSTRIYFRAKDASEPCDIDTHESTQFTKNLLSSWHSSEIRRSACLQHLIPSSPPRLAESYYFEMLACLAEAQDVDERIDILDEFSEEVMLDLELKDLCFRSREIFVSGYMICQRAFSQPSGLTSAKTKDNMKNEFNAKSRDDFERPAAVSQELFPEGPNLYATPRLSSDGGPSAVAPRSRSNSFSRMTEPPRRRVSRSGSSSSAADAAAFDPSTGHDLSASEYQVRLQAIALSRLRLVRSVLKGLVSILFNSESVASRAGILAGPAPLDLSSWLSLLVPDVYGRLCERLGCAVAPDHIEISAEIDKSLGVARKSMTMNGGSRPTQADIDRKLRFRDRGNSFAEMILTPVKQKEILFGDHVSYISPELPNVRRSVVDFQTILTAELSRISAVGTITATMIGRSRADAALNITIVPPGDVWVHQDSWAIALENLVLRVSELLDDFLASEVVTAQLTKEVHQVVGLTPRTGRVGWRGLSPGGGGAGGGDSRGDRSARRSAASQLFREEGAGEGVVGGVEEGRAARGDFSTPRRSGAEETDKMMSTFFSFSPAAGTGRGQPPSAPPSARTSAATPRESRFRWGISVPPSPSPYGRGFSPAGRDSSRERGRMRQSAERESREDGGGRRGERGMAAGNGMFSIGRGGRERPPSLKRESSDSSITRSRSHASLSSPNRIRSYKGIGDETPGSRRALFFAEKGVQGQLQDPYNYSHLETQEILLFYTTFLLRTLALDSAKIREVLGRDLDSFWISIMNVLNIICPRPTQRAATTKAKATTAGSGTGDGAAAGGSTRGGLWGSDSGGPGGAVKSADEAEGVGSRAAVSESTPGGFWATMKAKLGMGVATAAAAAPGGTASEAVGEATGGTGSKGPSIAAGSKGKPDSLTKAANATASEKSVIEEPNSVMEVKNLSVEARGEFYTIADYGAPRYGLTASSWALLVLTRKTVEDVVNMLGLRLPMRAMGFVPADVIAERQLAAEVAARRGERLRKSASTERDREGRRPSDNTDIRLETQRIAEGIARNQKLKSSMKSAADASTALDDGERGLHERLTPLLVPETPVSIDKGRRSPSPSPSSSERPGSAPRYYTAGASGRRSPGGATEHQVGARPYPSGRRSPGVVEPPLGSARLSARGGPQSAVQEALSAATAALVRKPAGRKPQAFSVHDPHSHAAAERLGLDLSGLAGIISGNEYASEFSYEAAGGGSYGSRASGGRVVSGRDAGSGSGSRSGIAVGGGAGGTAGAASARSGTASTARSNAAGVVGSSQPLHGRSASPGTGTGAGAGAGTGTGAGFFEADKKPDTATSSAAAKRLGSKTQGQTKEGLPPKAGEHNSSVNTEGARATGAAASKVVATCGKGTFKRDLKISIPVPDLDMRGLGSQEFVPIRVAPGPGRGTGHTSGHTSGYGLSGPARATAGATGVEAIAGEGSEEGDDDSLLWSTSFDSGSDRIDRGSISRTNSVSHPKRTKSPIPQTRQRY